MKKNMILLAMVGALLGVIVGCDNGDEPTNEPVNPALRAEPVAAASNYRNPVILDSWTQGDKNFYVIYAGYINNSLISQLGPIYYNGQGVVTLATSEATEISVEKSRTETISNSIVVSDGLTNTVGISTAVTMGVEAGFDKLFSVKSSVESTIESSFEISRTINVEQGRSKETSTSFTEALNISRTASTSMEIGREDLIGFHRIAWYVVSDVYFIISTSSDNQKLLSWDIVSAVRGNGVPIPHSEYSREGDFDNSPLPGSEIKFADDFYKTLPKPISNIPILRDTTAVFDIAGDHSFHVNVNNGVPATVEVYALGAGGGGQGGHYNQGTNLGFGCIDCYDGSGASGGGGAASYVKFTISQQTTFEITVGRGGAGGKNIRANFGTDWYAGDAGGAGGNSSITWGSVAITAEGGQGGGGGYRNLDAGRGGMANTEWPAGNLGRDAAGGKNGVNGSQKDVVESRGGNAASINIGTLGDFGGGSGALRNSGSYSFEWQAGTGGGGASGVGYDDDRYGSNGGNGKVVVVISYIEEL